MEACPRGACKRKGGEEVRLDGWSLRMSSSGSSSGSMNAGSGDRGGIVSGFTGWNMGGIWVGGDGTLMGLVVG
jgi:hypothetical protein